MERALGFLGIHRLRDDAAAANLTRTTQERCAGAECMVAVLSLCVSVLYCVWTATVLCLYVLSLCAVTVTVRVLPSLCNANCSMKLVVSAGGLPTRAKWQHRATTGRSIVLASSQADGHCSSVQSSRVACCAQGVSACLHQPLVGCVPDPLQVRTQSVG